MNTLEEKLQLDLMAAMKSHDKTRTDAIRSIKTAIQNEKTNGAYHELTDADIVKLIQKLIKQRLESEEIYTSANRIESAQAEANERKVLEEYTPKNLSEDELKTAVENIVKEIGATTIKDMGKVMKTLNERYPNQIDGKVASGYIKTYLV